MKYKIIVGEHIITYTTKSLRLAMDYSKKLKAKNPNYSITVIEVWKNLPSKVIKRYY